jgi:hypothetical protein
MKTIKSTDYKTVIAENFEVLIDPAPKHAEPVIGLKIDPTRDRPFIVPMKYEAAKEIAELILRTLFSVAPELFNR